MGERTDKILKELNEKYERDRATVEGMAPDEKKVLVILILAAALIAGLTTWIF